MKYNCDELYSYGITFNTLRSIQINYVLQTTFSYAFSWIKMHQFRLKFHWRLFLRVRLTTFQHWVRYWLGTDQVTSHYLTNYGIVYWRIYASLGLNELMCGVCNNALQSILISVNTVSFDVILMWLLVEIHWFVDILTSIIIIRLNSLI